MDMFARRFGTITYVRIPAPVIYENPERHEMKVDDFGGVNEVHNSCELMAVLKKTYGPGANEFWLYHDGKYPALTIWVKDNLATLHYFPGNHPGFRSVGNMAELEKDGVTIFYTESTLHKESAPNRFVVSLDAAVKAAMEFLLSKELPRSMEWFEL
jgi:hypothetical protein